jgi:hypothetical protein
VQVVEHDQQRRLARQQLQQRAHRRVHAMALVQQRRRRLARDARAQPRQDRRQRGDDAGVERVGQLRMGADVVVERVDPDGEGEVGLELGRAAGQHERAALARAVRQLADEAALADAGLACQRGGVGPVVGERRLQRGQLAISSDQSHGDARSADRDERVCASTCQRAKVCAGRGRALRRASRPPARGIGSQPVAPALGPWTARFAVHRRW